MFGAGRHHNLPVFSALLKWGLQKTMWSTPTSIGTDGTESVLDVLAECSNEGGWERWSRNKAEEVIKHTRANKFSPLLGRQRPKGVVDMSEGQQTIRLTGGRDELHGVSLHQSHDREKPTQWCR